MENVGRKSSVASLGGAGDHFWETFLWLNLQRTVDKRGRTGKKCAGDPPLLGDDTRVKAIKVTVMSKKGRQG